MKHAWKRHLALLLAAAALPALAQERRREVKWNNPDGPKIAGVTHHSFRSTWMEREVGYNVYLPPGYERSKRVHYPVIYFLHGAGGSENSDAGGFSSLVGRLIEQKKIPPVICVFPNGGMSGYEDRREDRIMVRSMLIRELIPRIDGAYRTQSWASGRAVAGFSMGGGGALRLSHSAPFPFSAAASWAGAILPRSGEIPEGFKPEELKQNAGKVRTLMIVGDQDFTLANNETVLKLLTDAGHPPKWVKLQGVGHNLGAYYEQTGTELVQFVTRDFKLLDSSDSRRD